MAMKKEQNRKYLNELGTSGNCMDVAKCGRGDFWKKQRCTFGFDERETWCLGATMVELLYERLRMYKEICIIDLSYHTFTINSVSKTQGEWIDILLEKCKERILSTSFMVPADLEKEIWTIWSEISPTMWW